MVFTGCLLWFHHIFSLGYETTAVQMRSVLQGITSLLEKYPLVKYFPTPVRFLRLSAYSLDVEIFAHLAVSDLGRFLELQGQLLLEIMEVIEAEGVRLAIPAQTAYLAVSSGFRPVVRARATRFVGATRLGARPRRRVETQNRKLGPAVNTN